MKVSHLGSALLTISLMLASGCATHTVPHHEKAFSKSPYRDLQTLPEGSILHLPTGVELKKEQMFNYISGSRIIYVGETHTNIKDHEIQLEILKEMHERFPGQVSVGMEMFQTTSQGSLDLWTNGNLDEKDFERVWHDNWAQDYAYYREIFQFIRDQKIPLIGLNAPKELVQAIMQKGVEGLPESLKDKVPEMDLTDEYHRSSVKAVFGGHGQGESGFDQFYRTMLIWDETMAESIANYLSRPAGHGKKMVVFSGGFHVNYGFGIPRRVFKRLPEPYSIILPYTAKIPENRYEILMDIQPVSIPLYLADIIWAVGYKDLEEDAVRLGVQIEEVMDGVRVQSVMADSTADKSGIKVGDIILSFDGESIREIFDLQYLVGNKEIGDRASIVILRNSNEIEIEAEFLAMEIKKP